MAITQKELNNILKGMDNDQLNNAISSVATAMFNKKVGTKPWRDSRQYLTQLQKESNKRQEESQKRKGNK